MAKNRTFFVCDIQPTDEPSPCLRDDFQPTMIFFLVEQEPTCKEFTLLQANLAELIPTFAFPWESVTKQHPDVVGTLMDPRYMVSALQFIHDAGFERATERPDWFDDCARAVEESAKYKVCEPDFEMITD